MKFEIWNEIKLVFTSASSLPFSPQHPVSCPKGCMSEALLAQSALCVIIHWINNFPAKCWSFRIILCFSFLFLNLLQLWLSQQQLRMSRWEGQEVKGAVIIVWLCGAGSRFGDFLPSKFPHFSSQWSCESGLWADEHQTGAMGGEAVTLLTSANTLGQSSSSPLPTQELRIL